jgi:putative PEP-CTERM system TPR-repeat lipoprotein
MTTGNKILALLLASLLSACGYALSDSERIDSAAEMMTQGDYRGAAIQLKNVLTRNPDNPDARLMLAHVHLGQNDIESSEKEARIAAELGASGKSIALLRLEIMLARSEYTDLLAALSLVEDVLSPAQVLQYRGAALTGLRNGDAALQTYRDWQVIEPDSADAAVGEAKAVAIQGHTDEAMDLLNKLLARYPKHADGWLTLANLHYSNGNYEPARQAFKESLAALEGQANVRQSVIALLGLADTDLMLQDVVAARATIQLLKQYAPTAPESMLQSARLSILEKDFPEAARKLQKLDQMFPDNVRVLTLLATVQWRIGNIQQAGSHLSRVVSLVPNNLHARKMLAQIQLRQSNTSAALETLDPLLSLQDGDPELYRLLAIADFQTGNSKRAIEGMLRYMQLNPDDKETRYQLGEMYLRSGEPEKTIELLGTMPFSDTAGFRRERILLAAYQRLGHVESAVEITDRLIKVQPPVPEALNLAADYYFLAGMTRQSRDILERSREIGPDNIDTLLQLAQLELSENQHQNARALYGSVNRIDASNLPALIGIARVAFETGDTAAAIQFLRLACDKHPAEAVPRMLLAKTYYAAGDFDAAEAQAREILRMGSINPGLSRSLGRLLMQLGAMEEARAQFEGAVRHAPASIDALVDLAHYQFAQDEIEQATATLDRALALNPASRAAQAAMVVIELHQGRTNEAARRLAELQSRYPDDLALSLLHGEVLFAAGAFVDAADAFNEAIAMGAGLNTVMREYESLRRANGERDPALALLRWLNQYPDDLFAQMQLAQHYQQRGASTDAIELYDKLAQSRPENPTILNNLAWEYYRVGDLERARGLAEKAREIQPDSGDIADTLGMVFRGLGDYEKAIVVLHEAVALSPQNPEIQYHLAVTLAEAGNHGEAQSILRAIVESDRSFPSRPEAMALIAKLD